MQINEVAAIHEQTLEPALALTSKQLRQASDIVSGYGHSLSEDARATLTAAVLQALATNFHALHTG